MTRKRANNAHTLHLAELPVITTGGIRIELSCPSGCVQGYLWSRSADDSGKVRAAAQAIADQHLTLTAKESNRA